MLAAPLTVSRRSVAGRRAAGAPIDLRPERYSPVKEFFARATCPGRSLGDEPAAEAAGAGTEIDHVIGALDGFPVVLDDDDGVPQVPEPRQVVEQAAVVPGMQPDGRLVEDVQHAAQLRAKLRRQPHALRFAARQGRGRAVELKYVRPTFSRKRRRLRISPVKRPATVRCRSLSFRPPIDSASRFNGSAAISAIDSPAMRTAKLSGCRRRPPHAGHGCADMYIRM